MTSGHNRCCCIALTIHSIPMYHKTIPLSPATKHENIILEVYSFKCNITCQFIFEVYTALKFWQNRSYALWLHKYLFTLRLSKRSQGNSHIFSLHSRQTSWFDQRAVVDFTMPTRGCEATSCFLRYSKLVTFNKYFKRWPLCLVTHLYILQDLKIIKNGKGYRDHMPNSIETS